MRVLINRCFGGFGLSDQAFEALLERRGIAFERQERQPDSWMGVAYYRAGHVGEDEHYLSQHELASDRADADLIAVVDALGLEAASGEYCELAMVEIPDGVSWHIAEYDGMEHVAEDHRTWY
jgi:hypothetical protein